MQSPKEAADRHIAAFNAKDADGFVGNESPDIEFVIPGGITLRGRDQVRAYIQIFWSAFPDAHVQPLVQVVTDEAVVTEATFAGTHSGALQTPNGEIPATGRRVTVRQVAVQRIAQGRVASEHLYFDQMELMGQLGLVPSPAQEV